MPSLNPQRRKQGESVKHRAKSPAVLSRCAAPGCQRLTSRAQQIGVGTRHCRPHEQHLARHGSTWGKTLSPKILKPFRDATREWLRKNGSDPFLLRCRASLEELLRAAGPVEAPHDLAKSSPSRKANAALARLREANIPALRIVLYYMSIRVALRSDELNTDSTARYRHVQIGKQLQRLASSVVSTRIRKVNGSYRGVIGRSYPSSRGMALVYLGQWVEACCDAVLGRESLIQVAALVAERRMRPPPHGRPKEQERQRRARDKLWGLGRT